MCHMHRQLEISYAHCRVDLADKLKAIKNSLFTLQNHSKKVKI